MCEKTLGQVKLLATYHIFLGWVAAMFLAASRHYILMVFFGVIPMFGALWLINAVSKTLAKLKEQAA